MNRSTTRNELICAGSRLIARQGFNGTGLNAILAAAKVPKGSFYYYFTSKEDFGLAVIEHLDAEYSARLDQLLLDKRTSPLARLRTYFQAGIDEVRAHDYGHGCVIGNLSQELAAQNETFRGRLDTVFADWSRRLACCIDEAREAGEITSTTDSRQLAEFILNGWEGAIMRAKLMRSTAPMKSFADLLFRYLLT